MNAPPSVCERAMTLMWLCVYAWVHCVQMQARMCEACCRPDRCQVVSTHRSSDQLGTWRREGESLSHTGATKLVELAYHYRNTYASAKAHYAIGKWEEKVRGMREEGKEIALCGQTSNRWRLLLLLLAPNKHAPPQTQPWVTKSHIWSEKHTYTHIGLRDRIQHETWSCRRTRNLSHMHTRAQRETCSKLTHQVIKSLIECSTEVIFSGVVCVCVSSVLVYTFFPLQEATFCLQTRHQCGETAVPSVTTRVIQTWLQTLVNFQ